MPFNFWSVAELLAIAFRIHSPSRAAKFSERKCVQDPTRAQSATALTTHACGKQRCWPGTEMSKRHRNVRITASVSPDGARSGVTCAFPDSVVMRRNAGGRGYDI